MIREIQDPQVERAIRSIHELAEGMLARGIPRQEAQRRLVDFGLDDVAAARVIEKAERTSAQRAQAAPAPEPVVEEEDPVLARMREDLGRSNATDDMIHGAVIFVAGILITAVTYKAASGGGVYVVTWGAILFGFIKFLKGLGGRFG